MQPSQNSVCSSQIIFPHISHQNQVMEIPIIPHHFWSLYLGLLKKKKKSSTSFTKIHRYLWSLSHILLGFRIQKISDSCAGKPQAQEDMMIALTTACCFSEFLIPLSRHFSSSAVHVAAATRILQQTTIPVLFQYRQGYKLQQFVYCVDN